MKKMSLRSGFGYDVDAASDESALRDFEVTLTKQSFAEEADINTIVRRFGITGALPQDVRAPTFGDFVGVVDFQTAMNAVVQARESFDLMPADVRTRFRNDPQEFVEFCSDPKNASQVADYGLLSPEAYAKMRAAADLAAQPGVKDGASNRKDVDVQSGGAGVDAGGAK